MQYHPTPKCGRETDIQAESSISACRRYLCAVATVCAAAAGDPNPAEVLAAIRMLWDMPRTLECLEVAA